MLVLLLIAAGWSLLCLLAIAICTAARQGDRVTEALLTTSASPVLRSPRRARGDRRGRQRPAATG